MSSKRVPIASRPTRDPVADIWVRQGDTHNDPATAKGDVFTARLTIDVTPELRARIKVAAFRSGVTVADRLRELLEREFPEERDA